MADLADRDYDSLAPFAWPAPRPDKARASASERFFATGGFFHGDGRARFVATVPRAPAHAVGSAFPIRLNTGTSGTP